MSDETKPQAPAKQPTAKPQDIDWPAAIKHLDKVETEVKALALDENGQAKPKMNPFHYIKTITAPLRSAAGDEQLRDAGLYASIMQLKAEEPSVDKFFRNPINGGRTGVAVVQPLPPAKQS